MTWIPKKLGKYEVLDVAGRGNMGIVYVAHDPFEDRKVAIKVCSISEDDEDGSSNRLARKLFFNEAHTAGSLNHPNILRVLDAGEQDGEPYIVMEYLGGAQTLKPYCEVDALLPVEQVVEIIYKCAQALDYAHRRGVVHRDIKPTNVMLTGDGDVRVGDFGIAQRLTSDDTTQVMGMVGSPRYMSPEQAREDSTNNQTDLFSLGVVMYEMLTGKAPFAAPGFSRLIYKILHEEPPRISDLRSDLPAGLEDVVDRALAKDLDKRYRMGRDLAADLAGIFASLEQSEPDMTEQEKFRLIRDLSFFNDFSDAELWEVIRASVWEVYGPGEQIISEGSLEHSFFIIVAGEVGVLKRGADISSLRTGDCFGEMGYLSKIKRTASIEARDSVCLLKINATLMERASLPCQLRFNKVFLKTLIHRLARTSEHLSQAVG